jgi:hypothetical protein
VRSITLLAVVAVAACGLRRRIAAALVVQVR